MSSTTSALPARAAAPWTLKRVVTAGVIGNVLEWYDFAVYGFFAPILAAQFFPVRRPHGCRCSPRSAPSPSVSSCGLSAPHCSATSAIATAAHARCCSRSRSWPMPTVLMGLLPTYATIGIAASLLIVVLRMCQGVAVGGEFTSSIVFLAEHAPAQSARLLRELGDVRRDDGHDAGRGGRRRCSRTRSRPRRSHPGAGAPRSCPESPWPSSASSFAATCSTRPAAAERASPLKVAFRDHRRQVLRVLGLNLASAATYYTLFVYAATWVAQTTDMSARAGARHHDADDPDVSRRAADRGLALGPLRPQDRAAVRHGRCLVGAYPLADAHARAAMRSRRRRHR